jgi:signal transduction histidine kinase/DNA-binding response OmpR family regulator
MERWLDASAEEAGDGDRPIVLLVDDNADMRDYLSRVLEPRWRVLTAEDGLRALEVARKQKIDLVLTDAMMPGLDGFQLVARLRAEPSTREVPVLMLSARAGEESRVEGFEAGADDYLVKPFSNRELISRVTNLLTMHRLRREATEREAAARRMAEREQRRAEVERERLHAIFMQAPALICVLRGPDHVFEFVNPVYADTVAPGRPLLGRPVREALPEVVAQGYVEVLDEVYRSGESYTARAARVVLEEPQGKRDVFVNFVYQPMRDASGTVDGIFVHAVDVTDLVNARSEAEALAAALEQHRNSLEEIIAERTGELRSRTRELEAANTRLRELDRMKSEFLATVSHELRTPLNAIIGFSQVLLDLPEETWRTDAPRAYVGHIARSGEQLLAIVNDVLDLARIEAGRLLLEVREVELGDVLAEAVDVVTQSASRKGLAIEVAAPSMRVRVDPQRLQQMLLNLLTNAVKFSSDGVVWVHARVEGHTLRVSVRDFGVGIAEERLPELFTPFHPVTAGTAQEPGSGLGLAIAQRLAEAHGGRIDIESSVGEGSTFTLVLPDAVVGRETAP